jgi:hypothetical protein
MRTRLILFSALPLLWSLPGQAEVPFDEAGRAQGAMYKRINQAVTAYAERIGIGEPYTSYCWTKMNMATEHSANGMVPYGVDYHHIANEEELNTIISAREHFEQAYLILCLADAKRTLDVVGRGSAR